MRRTITNYLHETDNNYSSLNLVNLPSSVSNVDSGGTEIARTEYAYDAYSLASYSSIPAHDPAYNTGYTRRGNPTDVRRLYKEASRYLTTSMHYDITGNVLSTTDPKGSTTNVAYSYATYYAYPATVTNALGHVTTFAWWNYGFPNGDLQSKTDANGVVVEQFWYDYLGRKTQETTPAETKNFSYDDYSFLATAYSSSGYGYTTSNPTGQALDVRHSDPAGANVEQSASYNASGQPLSTSPVYRQGSYSGASVTYTYDVLGRLLTVNRPWAGQTTYQYVGNTTYVTDADGKTKIYYS